MAAVKSSLRFGEIFAIAESEIKFDHSASAEFHCAAISLCAAEFHLPTRGNLAEKIRMQSIRTFLAGLAEMNLRNNN